MGIFQKARKNHTTEEEDAATVAVRPSTKQEPTAPPQTVAQWKKAKKQERKARSERFATKSAKRSTRIHQLVLHGSASRSGGPQNEYCSSPDIVASNQQAVHKAASVGWGTAKIAAKNIFGLGKKTKNKSKDKTNSTNKN
eukprot:CAMPEP_0201130172 /NCGR_PEP_ID=MMETSP0850-20130426/39044_1 /ASSEMBLY_ACC=CAM_ASM_000622 /TAXON_ID=183588 /ORGANISM="Pseudo-nitzschia fraudulenta, Strain WWA7" /LENGTH=139 /DNA_ID=CAMNT_0047399871 /DNA_START=44 /DNA_END=463 /DNA_ORIENTATION=-